MVIVLGLLRLGIEIPCLFLVDEITELFLTIVSIYYMKSAKG